MDGLIATLVLILLIPLVGWMRHRRSQRAAHDAERLMRNILGEQRDGIKKDASPRTYTNVDDRLYTCLITHFDGLNAARKSLRVVAESAHPINVDALIFAVNAMQLTEGKNAIPDPIMQLVFDGLLVGGLLDLREGMYQASTEGKLLNDLIRT